MGAVAALRIAGLVLLAVALLGATVRSVGVAELVRGSEFIFEGRVNSVHAERDPASGLIVSSVNFEVIDVLKGPLGSASVDLRFLGGTLGMETLSIPGMELPRIGERGVYFVESLSRLQVHPFSGWSQGHFLLLPDATGKLRLHTRAGAAIVSIDPAPPPSPLERYSNDVARGIEIAGVARPGKAIRGRDFKRVIRGLARKSAR